jgi:hypothetical protein
MLRPSVIFCKEEFSVLDFLCFSDFVCCNSVNLYKAAIISFDVITSLVSLEHGVDGWEKMTSQRKLALERAGVTSLRDIWIVGMHVIRCHSNGTIWPLWVQRPPERQHMNKAYSHNDHHWGITITIKRRYHVKHLYYRSDRTFFNFFFQRKIYSSRFSAYPDCSSSQLIRISGVLLNWRTR